MLLYRSRELAPYLGPIQVEDSVASCAARFALIHALILPALVLPTSPSVATPQREFYSDYVPYAVDTGPYAVALEDLNLDGLPDLAVANNGRGTVSVLVNLGDGTFGPRRDYEMGNGPWALAVADLNMDSAPDLVVANGNTGTYVSVLLGDGLGGFLPRVDYTVGYFPRGIAIGDLDGDGAVDIVSANVGSASVSILSGVGDGTFGERHDFETGSYPAAVAISDFNKDGYSDLVTANNSSRTVSILIGTGDGGFLPRVDYQTGFGPSSLDLGDLNLDGAVDLVVGSAIGNQAFSASEISVFLGNPDGTFRERSVLNVPLDPMGLTVDDLNGDRVPEVIATGNATDVVTVLIGLGDGTFPRRNTFPAGFGAWGVVAGDVNGDGRVDLAVTNSQSASVSILKGNGDATFGGSSRYETQTAPRSIAAGDLDADGWADIVVANTSPASISVLLADRAGSLMSGPSISIPSYPSAVAIRGAQLGRSADLIVTSPTANSLTVLSGVGDGSFILGGVYPTGESPQRVVIADLNEDGISDAITANESGNSVSVLIGDQSGGFQTRVDYPVGTLPQSVVAGDFNGDGLDDLATANYGSHSVSVLVNLGNGSFGNREDIGVSRPIDLTPVDLNGDGRLDLAVTADRFPGGVVITLLGLGDATLVQVGEFEAGRGPFRIVTEDFDLDGVLDAAVAGYTFGEFSVLHGKSDGTFEPRVVYGVGRQPYSIASSDFNRDGAPDLALAEHGSNTAAVVLNQVHPQDRPPLVSAPDSVGSPEGVLISFTVTATDPDGEGLATLTATGLPLGATFVPNASNTLGMFQWTPNFSEAGLYNITFTAMNALSGSAIAAISVLDQNRGPVADANGPYSGVVGVLVEFSGTSSSDPDGQPLGYLWDFGDGASASGAAPSHAYGTMGGYDVSLTVTDNGSPGLSDTDQTIATIAEGYEARVSTTGGNKTIRLGSGKPTWCAHVEPVNGSFEFSNLDLQSMTLAFGGSKIPAISGKTVVAGDDDKDGVAEIEVCFTKDDLRTLFAGLPSGRQTVDVEIAGNLISGGAVVGTISVDVVASGGGALASVSPNPLNPSATLSFTTATAGPIRVRLFDLSGRLVRTLADWPSAATGYHDLTIDGRSDRGEELGSGVYFFRIESADGVAPGRLSILR